ncbi:MAG TPA: hypothetical protein VKY71_05560 [Actinotalea caeni]|uniref:hypothetical protein n=1 Tax=Actinotalea caeni TaxID=1348467 RepID=UPI0012E31385|nr:hypothetical protein [Actinotalea caeni]HLV55022.1 hypothetical protein [Actinotalea caeni]
MIIWRGWGIVALPLVALLVFGLGTLISTGLLGHDALEGVGAGIGLLVAAPVTWLLGRWLNQRSAEKAADRYVAARQPELHQQVHQAAENQTLRDLQGLSQEDLQMRWHDAYARNRGQLEGVAVQQLASEREEVRRRLRNQNSLFFIPVQWLWVPLAAGGVLALTGGLAGS